MTLGLWMSPVTWIALAVTASAQFNDTVKFTLTSWDPMVDVDGASNAWTGQPFTLDSATGYRTSTGRSSGNAGFWFVGTGFDLQGRALWKLGGAPAGAIPLTGVLSYPGQREEDSTLPRFNLTAKESPDLASLSTLELAAYELMVSWFPVSAFEFHNITIDVPIKSQA